MATFEPKRRKIEPPRRFKVFKEFTNIKSVSATKSDAGTSCIISPTVPVIQSSFVHPSIIQAKNFAVAQAQQDGSKAHFNVFDSPFGNFLVPVIPTRAELGG